MAISLTDWGSARGVGTTVAVAASAAPTAAPSGDVGIDTDRFDRVRTLFRYAGAVDSCSVRIWLRDRSSGDWYEGPTTDDLDPLTPGGASPVNEAREWEPGVHQEVYFQVVAIAGGGTVEVRAQGVQA